jgi:hypothetical protein
MRIAMAESQVSANAKWTPQEQDRVDAAIRKMARMLPRFTADQVWYELGASFPVTKGMTARLLVAQRNGVIRNTGETTFAERGGKHDHAQRLTIWQSL